MEQIVKLRERLFCSSKDGDLRFYINFIYSGSQIMKGAMRKLTSRFPTATLPIGRSVNSVLRSLSESTSRSSNSLRSKTQFRSYTAQDTQDRNKQPVLVSRVNEDYVENTLTPHLEGQILYNIHVYGPLELSRIARGYSMIPIRQRILCQKLSEQIKFRMCMFTGMSLVETIGSMWTLLPEDEELFEMLGERIVDVIDDFNALNLIGIIRIYNKLQHYEILSILVPRLQELLREYDEAELMDMMVALAHAGTAVQDMDVLVCLVPEILRRFDDVPLQVKITHLWCMTKLKITHEDMLGRCARDLTNPNLTRGMPASMVCRVLWIYARSGALDMVLGSMEGLLIENNGKEASCADFARLSQTLLDNHISDQKGDHVMNNTTTSFSEETAGKTTGTFDATKSGVSGSTPSAETLTADEIKSSSTSSSDNLSSSSQEKLKSNDLANQQKQLISKLSDRQQAMRLLHKMADRLQATGISMMGRKEVILYLLGCVRCDLLARDDIPDFDAERVKLPGERRKDKLYEIFAYFFEEQDNFERDEIERIVTALWFHEDHRSLVDNLPKSWTTFVDEILCNLEGRAEEQEWESEQAVLKKEKSMAA